MCRFQILHRTVMPQFFGSLTKSCWQCFCTVFHYITVFHFITVFHYKDSRILLKWDRLFTKLRVELSLS